MKSGTSTFPESLVQLHGDICRKAAFALINWKTSGTSPITIKANKSNDNADLYERRYAWADLMKRVWSLDVLKSF